MANKPLLNTKDFLVEIGTEELPPKSLQKLSEAFGENLKNELANKNLSFEAIKLYATPRRLAILVNNLPISQADYVLEKNGPLKKAAFDEQGKPTNAALGFAKSCGVDFDQIEIKASEKGESLYFAAKVKGEKTIDLLPNIVENAIKNLPIPKPMRWGNHSVEFVRPAHWVVMLFGTNTVNGTILGIKAGNQSYGHRFHHPEPILIKSPTDYAEQLRDEGHVIVDFHERKEKIREDVVKCAKNHGEAQIDEALLEEVTAINEWPVAILGNFDPQFLNVPHETLICAMQQHQRYFPVVDKNHQLLPHFVTVSNIQSKKMDVVIHGNERVLKARLSDAKFFYQSDIKHSLDTRVPQLQGVIFQIKLGSLHDKTERISQLANHIATRIQADNSAVNRAAFLCKADLLSEMVGEFPSLQGIMGYYYALQDKEDKNVALAIKEHYLPRFAGDKLPSDKIGCAVSIADKIDTLVGIFGIDQKPTGTKDPFALRRAAIGVLRIIIEKQLPIDLRDLISFSRKLYDNKISNPNTEEECLDFIMDRLRAWYVENGIGSDVFAAVHARYPTQPYDFDQRIKAVQHFQSLPEAQSLAAANKRVSNILKKSDDNNIENKVNNKLLIEQSEKALAKLLSEKHDEIEKLTTDAKYTDALSSLATLREPVDSFFDQVHVMTDDTQTRENRLILLSNLRNLFLQIADISLLQTKI